VNPDKLDNMLAQFFEGHIRTTREA
jgi:hypothetical protein